MYDCRDHGISQSRRRMLLVAIAGKLATPWVEPEPMAMTEHLDCFVDGRGPTELTESQRLRRDEEVARWRSKVKNKDPIIVDIAASARFASSQPGCCPTLTATRASNHHGFYCTTKGACLSTADKARLMGIPPNFSIPRRRRSHRERMAICLGMPFPQVC